LTEVSKTFKIILIIGAMLFSLHVLMIINEGNMMRYSERKYYFALHSVQEGIDGLIELEQFDAARKRSMEMFPAKGEEFHIYYEYNKARIDFLTGHYMTAARCAELHLENVGKCERFLTKSRYTEYYEYCMQTIEESEKIIKAYEQQQSEQKPAINNTDSDTD
jgi:hypothetical protein